MKKQLQEELLYVEIPNVPVVFKKDATPHTLYDFEKLKNKLNDTKSKMDEYYLDSNKYRDFVKITSCLQPTQPLRFFVMNNKNGQLVTRAWLKYYEITKHFNLMEEKNEFYVFMNAEFPGAATSAMNHMAKTKFPKMKYNWYAASIIDNTDKNNPRGLLGDKYGLCEMNKSNWLMNLRGDPKAPPGDPKYINNGDATNWDNLVDYEKKIHKVDLYSHDAGIDSSGGCPDPSSSLPEQTGFNTQEYQNAKIHLGCACAGFLTMAKGANCIFKQFTFFETFTIDLILIYATLFEKFYICKPMTSGQSNSEIYLVGKGFKGMDDYTRGVFENRMRNFSFVPFIEKNDKINDVQKSISKIYDFCKLLNDQQIEFINETIYVYNKYKKNNKAACAEYAETHKLFQNIWLDKYSIDKISINDYLASKKLKTEYN